MKKEESKSELRRLAGVGEGAEHRLVGFRGDHRGAGHGARRQIAKTGARYQVVPNSLIERAAEGTAASSVAKGLRGTTSLAYTETDPVALAKVLTTYAKENPILVFKTGMVEGRVVAMADLAAIANLPARDPFG